MPYCTTLHWTDTDCPRVSYQPLPPIMSDTGLAWATNADNWNISAGKNCCWVGPCEKVSENIDPFENHFFVINYQHWTGTSALQWFWVPPDPWGGLGGPGGVWGGLPTPKLPLLFGDQFQPWNAMFWVKTTCNTMFLMFWVKWGPPGSKKAVLGPNRVCKKVDFSQKHHLQICSNRTKMALWGQ